MRRFEQFQALRQETTDLKMALEDRKIIEPAKGLLMKNAGLDERNASAAAKSCPASRTASSSKLRGWFLPQTKQPSSPKTQIKLRNGVSDGPHASSSAQEALRDLPSRLPAGLPALPP